MATFIGRKTGFTVLEGGEVLQVDAWGESGARVRSTLGASTTETPGSALGEAGATDAQVEITDDRARVRNGDLVVEVYDNHEERFVPFPPLVRFLRADGEELFGESVPHFTAPPQRRYRRGGGDLYGCEVTFERLPGGALLRARPAPARPAGPKGAVIDLVQRNTEVSIPFALSSRGYGFLWNMPGGRPRRAGRQPHAVGRRRGPADRLLGDRGRHTGRHRQRRYARVTGPPAHAAGVGGRFLAVQAALPEPGRAPRGRARAQAARPAARR